MSAYRAGLADAPTGGETFRQSLQRIFEECPTLSDFTIHCGGRSWAVHRVILAASSRFFEKLCTGRFKETREKMVCLDDDSPDDVDRMIRCFYTEAYSTDMPVPASADCEPGNMLMHARLVVLGDKYDCPDLVCAAQHALLGRIDGWVRAHPDEETSDGLVKELLDALPFIYAQSSPVSKCLRSAAVLASQSGQGRHLKNHVSRETWEGLMRDIPDYVLDVLQYQAPPSPSWGRGCGGEVHAYRL